ncbi:MAG: polysaccharide deacetylase family protein [Actinomycetota bacterium]
MSILCYHSVDPAWRSPLAVTPAEFARQCEWLARRRRVVDLEHAVTMLNRRFTLPSGTTAITFDDGFAGLMAHAAPVLGRHRFPATVFIVAATLEGGRAPVDWVIGEQPPHPQTLTLAQVLEMQEAGIAFGSHSSNHRDLTKLSEAECESELRSSKQALTDLLGRPCRFLAYPSGFHDERVRRIAERVGYEAAFTLPERREATGRFAIPRVGVYPGNGPMTMRVKDTRWYLNARTSRLYPLLRPGSRLVSRPAG